MADAVVDRLVALIEADIRPFQTQLRKLEGQVNSSSRRMASSFKTFNRELASTSRFLGVGGLGGRIGIASAMAATYYAVDRATRAMGKLGEAVTRTGIKFDQSKLGDAQAWADDWESAGDRVNVVLSKLFSGQYSWGDIFSGQVKRDVQPRTDQHVVGTKGDLGEIPADAAMLDKINEDLALLDKSLQKWRDAANDAAEGATDSVRSFTHSLMDNPKDWMGALMGLGKGISGDIVDAGLFGSGPYAKMLGTAGPSGGGPGGVIGDAFGRLFGGGRDFGNPVPVEVVGVSGSGTVGGLLAGVSGGGTGKDMMSRILGGGTPLGVSGSGSGGASALASSSPSFLDLIARAEGTAGAAGGGYNTTLGYGRFLPGGTEQNLTSMTLDQVRALQTSMLSNPANSFNSSAAGRYQITRSTLDDLRTKLGLSGSELYDPQMQDALALNLAQMRGPGGVASTWAGVGQQSPGFLSQLLAMFPHFASGGSFAAGRPFIAGEQGPELVVPRAPGTVIPNGGGMGGGVTIIDRRTNAPPIQQRGNTLIIADHDKLMRGRYGIKPVQTGRT